MVEIIDIHISSAELAQRAERLARARRWLPVDRVPVYPNIYMRYWLPHIDGSYAEYFADPEVMLRSQILGQKWLLENIACDRGFEPVYVDFQNALDASALGCETTFTDDGLIWINEGWVRDEADLERLRGLDPLKIGLVVRALEYLERMRVLSDRYRVRLADGVELVPAARPQVSLGTIGPFTAAAQVAGLANLCEALYLNPKFVRALLEIVTEKAIDMLQFMRRVQGMDALWLADDYAVNLSAPQFREFVLPCLRRIRASLADLPLRFHMCGNVDHLIPMLAAELGMDEFTMFGFQVNKSLVRKMMRGRIVLMGNVNPMNIHSGTPATVLKESLEALCAFGGGKGGFILSDGANIAPGSPPENISAMWRAACQFAKES